MASIQGQRGNEMFDREYLEGLGYSNLSDEALTMLLSAAEEGALAFGNGEDFLNAESAIEAYVDSSAELHSIPHQSDVLLAFEDMPESRGYERA